MAEETVVRVVDDLDPSQPGEKRAVVGVNNIVVRLDLSEEHFLELLRTFQQYLDKGKRIVGVNLLRDDVMSSLDLKEIRVWAKKEGITMATRGRVPTEVIDRYIKEVVQVPDDPSDAP